MGPSVNDVTVNRIASRKVATWIVRPDRANDGAASGFDVTEAGMTLIATSRFNLASRARYTSPMPPAPSGARIVYGHSDSPAASDTGADYRRRAESFDGIPALTVFAYRFWTGLGHLHQCAASRSSSVPSTR